MFDPVLPLFTCAVCGRYVDRICAHHDTLTDEIDVTVECHGQREHLRLSHEVRVRGTVPKAFAGSVKAPGA